MKTILPFLLFTFIIFPVFSQTNSVTSLEKAYEGYLSNDRKLWQESARELQAAFRSSGYTDGEVLYALVLTQQGLIGGMYEDKPRDTEVLYKLLDQAERNAQRLLKFPAYKSQAHSFMGAILSIRVGLNTMKAIYLGSKIEDHYKEAARINPKDPSSWLERANLKFHSPGIFGGSNTEAIKLYSKAIELFDQQPALRKNNWHYLHALAWLGKAYQKAGQKEKAIAIYEKAIAFDGRFELVREELLPSAR